MEIKQIQYLTRTENYHKLRLVYVKHGLFKTITTECIVVVKEYGDQNMFGTPKIFETGELLHGLSDSICQFIEENDPTRKKEVKQVLL